MDRIVFLEHPILQPLIFQQFAEGVFYMGKLGSVTIISARPNHQE